METRGGVQQRVRKARMLAAATQVYMYTSRVWKVRVWLASDPTRGVPNEAAVDGSADEGSESRTTSTSAPVILHPPRSTSCPGRALCGGRSPFFTAEHTFPASQYRHACLAQDGRMVELAQSNAISVDARERETRSSCPLF